MGATRGSTRWWWWGADRAPPARRFAGKPAPTFVSGQSILCQERAIALFVRRDIEPCARAFARKSHRHNWSETNVGAGLPATRRAGGARSHRRHTTCGKHPAALTQPQAECFLHPATLYPTAPTPSSAILRRTQFEIVPRLNRRGRPLIYPAVSDNSSVRRT